MADETQGATAPKEKAGQSKAGPKDFFFHLLMIAMLYVIVVSGTALLFQYVNAFFPDQLSGSRTQLFDAIRWASSVLIVAYPVFVYVSYVLGKSVKQAPELRKIKIRRWLLSLTLFITAVTIIIDLMTLIYNFYGGDLTTSFTLKVLAVLAVAVVVLGYYRWELKRTDAGSNVPRIAAIVTGVAISGVVIGGVFIAGTPAEQRNVRFDEQRLEDLQEIQSETIFYWQQKDELPATLADLTDSISGFSASVDPETDLPYTYTVTDELSFELCATFHAEFDAEDLYGFDERLVAVPGTKYVETWSHPAGEYCFEREIDPELYGTRNNTLNEAGAVPVPR